MPELTPSKLRKILNKMREGIPKLKEGTRDKRVGLEEAYGVREGGRNE